MTTNQLSKLGKELIRHQGMQFGGNRFQDDDAHYFADRYFVVDTANGLIVKGPTPHANVLAYGAKLDGVNDDTAAIQAAVDVIGSKGGGIVQLPAGNAKITDTIYIRHNAVALLGSGHGVDSTANVNAPYDPATRITWAGALHGTMIQVGDPGPIQGVRIEKIGLVGGTLAGHAIYCDACQFGMFRDIGCVTGSHYGRTPLNANRTDPVVSTTMTGGGGVTPTVNATGGGASGGNLAAGVYSVKIAFQSHTIANTPAFATTEELTVGSNASADFTVAAGNIPQVDIGMALPTNAVGYSVYITRPGEHVYGLYSVNNTGQTCLLSAAYTPSTALHFIVSPEANAGGTRDSLGNVVENFYSTSFAYFARLEGPADFVGDVDMLTARHWWGQFNGIGIDVFNADNCWFSDLYLAQKADHTGYGLYLGRFARSNMFRGAAVANIYAELSAHPELNYSNYVYDFDMGNGSVAPTIEAGAMLTWNAIGNTGTGWHLHEKFIVAVNNDQHATTVPEIQVASDNASLIPTLIAQNDGTSGVARVRVIGEDSGGTEEELRIQGGNNSNAVVTMTAVPLRLGTNNGTTLELNGNKAFMGDTANAKMTRGLTLNQSTADDEILALKSADIAHSATTDTEDDTYATFAKFAPTTGGLAVSGYAGGPTTAFVGLRLRGVAEDATNARTTSASAPIFLQAAGVTSNTAASVGADQNLMALADFGTTRFIWDSDGSAFADVEWTTFDDENDVGLLTSLEAALAGRDALKADFHEWITEHRPALERLKLVVFNDDGHHFLNTTRLLMLLSGAVRQVAAARDSLEARVARLERLALKGA